MTRKECLEQAAKCVLQNRQDQYGEPEDCFGVIANFWSVYLGRKVYPHDVAMMMGLLKIARIKASKDYGDGYVDLAGYAACGAECASGTPSPALKDGDELVMLWKHKPEGKFAVKSHADKFFKAESGCCQNRNDQSEAKTKGNCFQNGNSSEFQSFSPGEKVEVYCFDPQGNKWRPATILSVYRDKDTCNWICNVKWSNGCIGHALSGHVRPAPKAEGCEALVEKDAPQTKEELMQRIVDCNPATYERPRTPTGEELAEMAEEEPHG